MAAKFDLTDDTVVVIIGSGAGGGTLANELAQRGIKVVILEAGPRHEIEDFVNDEWESFGQLAWKDMRTTAGPGGCTGTFPICRPGSSRPSAAQLVHWAGASLRFQEHEFKTRTVYGAIRGANLMDWPITLKDSSPTTPRPRTK